MAIPLPVHIVEVIFSKLSISNLPNCRLVCRAWNDLVLNSKSLISKGLFLVFTHDFDANRDPKYRDPKMHCVDTDTLRSVASSEFNTGCLRGSILCHCCNGLFFMSKSNPTRCFGILNPITNQFFQLPEFKFDDDDDDDDKINSFGFGFSPKTNQYKLFRIIHEGNNTSTCRMEVFRFSTHDQWSLVSNTLPFVNYKLDGAYLNGFIYWIVRKENASDEYVINVFDVETENFESTAVLKLKLGGSSYSLKIESFNDAVYITVCINKPSPIFEVWRMQGKDSCTRDFVFDGRDFNYCRAKKVLFVKAFEDGTMLVLIEGAYFCLDKMGRKVKIQTFDLNARLVTATCYLSSFNFGSLPHILAEHG